MFYQCVPFNVLTITCQFPFLLFAQLCVNIFIFILLLKITWLSIDLFIMQKGNLKILHGSTSVFLGGLILLEENRPIQTCLYICAEMWARRIICNSEICKQTKCPNTYNQLGKLQYVHQMKCNEVIKKDNAILHSLN